MAQQAPQYISTDPSWGTTQAPPPAAPDPKKESTAEAVGAAGRFLSGAWENLNPYEMARGFYSMLMGKDDAFKAGLKVGQAAREQFDAGDTGEAGMTLARNAPIVGPMVQKVEAGNYAGAAGNATALVAPFAAAKVKSLPVRPVMRSRNTTLARAMDTVMDEGVPIGAATASGRPWPERARYAADATSFLGLKDWDTPVAEGFRAMGGKLANETRPGATTSPEMAGASVAKAVDNVALAYKAVADPAYADLRAMARDPKNVQTVRVLEQAKDPKTGKPLKNPDGTPVMQPVMRPMEAPVDMRAAKKAYQHEYDIIDQTISGGQRLNDPGFTAISNIVNGPDFVPLEVALKNYSALGKGAKGTEAAGRRSAGEGLSAFAFNKLKAAVDQTLTGMGQDAVDAFKTGKTAHRQMKGVDDLLDAISPTKEGVGREPVQAFDRLVRPKDANIEMLRRVNAVAPAEMQNLARAWFESHLEKMTAHGGLEHTKAALNAWDALGDKTKTLFWPDPKVRQRVGDFMLAMKTWADSPNPSGTAAVNIMAHTMRGITLGTTAGNLPIGIALQGLAGGTSIAMHSPAVARGLVRGGARVPVRTPALVGAAANVVGQAADEMANRPVASHAPIPSAVASHEKVVSRAGLEAVAQSLGTDVATQEARAKAEGYVIRD